MDSRKKKIEMLSDIISGKKKIKDLPVYRVEIWTNGKCEKGYFRNELTGVILTKEQLEIRQKNKGDYLVMVIEERTYEE